jgi:isochorismatase family protein
MKRRHKLRPNLIAFLLILACFGAVARRANAQDIIDEWASVQIPPPPELKKVTVDPKTTALLVMGFVVDSCNVQPARAARKRFLTSKHFSTTRAHGVLIMHSVPPSNPSGDFIVKDLAPLPGEPIIPPNGPNRFLPVDVDFNKYSDFDLEKMLRDHGIRTVITVGTQVQTAVLHTAAEAALRGYKVIVPLDECQVIVSTLSNARRGT